MGKYQDIRRSEPQLKEVVLYLVLVVQVGED